MCLRPAQRWSRWQSKGATQVISHRFGGESSQDSPPILWHTLAARILLIVQLSDLSSFSSWFWGVDTSPRIQYNLRYGKVSYYHRSHAQPRRRVCHGAHSLVGEHLRRCGSQGSHRVLRSSQSHSIPPGVGVDDAQRLRYADRA